ncbi:MAG TPA: hypothetical protein VIG41_09665 [Micrococcaceae bacterium]
MGAEETFEAEAGKGGGHSPEDLEAKAQEPSHADKDTEEELEREAYGDDGDAPQVPLPG